MALQGNLYALALKSEVPAFSTSKPGCAPGASFGEQLPMTNSRSALETAAPGDIYLSRQRLDAAQQHARLLQTGGWKAQKPGSLAPGRRGPEAAAGEEPPSASPQAVPGPALARRPRPTSQGMRWACGGATAVLPPGGALLPRHPVLPARPGPSGRRATGTGTAGSREDYTSRRAPRAAARSMPGARPPPCSSLPAGATPPALPVVGWGLAPPAALSDFRAGQSALWWRGL